MNIKRKLFLFNILIFAIPIALGFLVTFAFMESWDRPNKYPNQPPPRFFSREVYISGIIMIVLVVISVILLNLFFTRFIFRKINKSLAILEEGVFNIHDGNLDYRIDYKYNDEFKPICEDFNEMAERLKQSVEESRRNEENRKELIAGMSHDLRSPLTSVRMFAEGLLENIAVTEESRQEYLRIIIAKADEITDRVNTLFLFSKMDIGDYPYVPEKLNVKKAITEIIEVMKPDYLAKGVEVNILSITDDVDIYIDPLQFNSIFSNIIDNSQKYKLKEVVTINISSYVEERKVKIIFEDDGPGVPEAALAKIFDIFYRSDIARSNTQKGSGLGLAIVKKAVERMRGKIFAENVESGGLRIIIQVPQYSLKNNNLSKGGL